MPSKLLTVENKSFAIMIDNTLTDFDQKSLMLLYQPIIGDKALNIYQTLYSMVDLGSRESRVFKHDILLKTIGLKTKSFVEERIKLEALGLLSTYYKDDSYIYVLKKVLTPYEFFKNEDLVRVLTIKIGDDEVTTLAYNLLLRRLDPSKYKDITLSFDEVFELDYDKNIKNYASFGVDTINNGITIKNDNFDMKYFLILLEAMDVLDMKVLNDTSFIELIYRYAFLYKLNVEEMKDAVVRSVNLDKQLDLNDLKENIKIIYDNRHEGINLVQKREVIKSNNKLINFLEQASPNDLVKHKYQTELTSGEIDMFDRLLRETNVSLGVINTALLYVLNEKNGEIPAYNYFLKIINTWKRAKITNAEEALAYVNGNRPTSSKSKDKIVRSKPSWYDSYTSNEKVQPKKEDENQQLVDLADFFKSNNEE